MDDKKITLLAERFQAFSDPNRLKLLKLIAQSPHPVCVNAMTMQLEISQSAVSQHLKVLRLAGLVKVKKEGYFKHYSVDQEGIDEFRQLAELVLGEKLV